MMQIEKLIDATWISLPPELRGRFSLINWHKLWSRRFADFLKMSPRSTSLGRCHHSAKIRLVNDLRHFLQQERRAAKLAALSKSTRRLEQESPLQAQMSRKFLLRPKSEI